MQNGYYHGFRACSPCGITSGSLDSTPSLVIHVVIISRYRLTLDSMSSIATCISKWVILEKKYRNNWRHITDMVGCGKQKKILVEI